MKRSRIICSIIAVAYTLISAILEIVLVRNTISVKSSVDVYIKIVYIAAFALCTLGYIWIKRRLERKTNNLKLIQIYRYLYIVVAIFVSRFALAYVSKNMKMESIVPSFSIGLGSYLNYAINLVVKNQLYSNVIVNTSLVFIVALLIKKIMLNITSNDTMATITSLAYVFLPQSMYYLTEYVRYQYNVVFILSGVLLLLKIIDEVKRYDKRTNKYLIYSLILGGIAGIDILFGGSIVFWIILLTMVTLTAVYVDIIHINLGNKLRNITNYKVKRLVEKIEKINISKLVSVLLIGIAIMALFTISIELFSSANNYEYINFADCIDKYVDILKVSRNYYIVVILIILIFGAMSIGQNRQIDLKVVLIKAAMLGIYIITPFMVTTTYTACILDVGLIITMMINICNIYYNREEKIKLIKDKN